MSKLDTTVELEDLNGNKVKRNKNENMVVGDVMRLSLDGFKSQQGGPYKLLQMMQTIKETKKPTFDNADLEILEKAVTQNGVDKFGNSIAGQTIKVIKDAKDE